MAFLKNSSQLDHFHQFSNPGLQHQIQPFGLRLLASLFSFSSVVGGNDDLILQFTYFTTNKQTDTPVSYPL